MNNQDAKFYLSAYRPGGADARDPAMAGALEHARRDPELSGWFKREQAHDAVVAQKLRSINPPADLRAAILAGGRVSGANRAWWQRSQWMGLAAAVLIMASLVGVWLSGWTPGAAPRGMAELASFALRELDGLHYPAHVAKDSVLGEQLLDETPRLAAGIALTPEELSSAGCHTLKVGGLEVFEVCFKRDRYYHLYLVRREDVRVESGDERPMLVAKDEHSVLTWADRRYVYMLAAKGEGENLRSLL